MYLAFALFNAKINLFPHSWSFSHSIYVWQIASAAKCLKVPHRNEVIAEYSILTQYFKYVLRAFYYTLGNIAPMYRSSGKAIQLLCWCKTSHIKKYGIDAILKPLIADLKKLEQVC